jgi:ATP-dependent DNA ligase
MIDGALLFVHACRMGLEGIVSKRLTAPYRSGPSRDWIKVRTQIVRRLSGRGAERRFQWSLDRDRLPLISARD